ncbi:MAG TPA: response regulator transcription factor [Acidimicrobiales bacterium]|nr:response regulator transcription factor [Acidimicrobiales bacterium]
MTDLLLVEDDPTLGLALGATLRDAGFEVRVATTGGDALAAVAGQPPAIIVLDLGLPDVDGADVLGQLRAGSDVPVVVLTARDERDVKLALLRDGADDYLTKPFDSEELVLRVHAVLRRAHGRAPRRVRAGDVVVDLDAGELVHDDATVTRLTPTELRLLEVLTGAQGRIIPHDELLRSVWGEAYGTESEYLRTFVAQLRRKLRDDASRPHAIQTHPGVGYRWIGSSSS